MGITVIYWYETKLLKRYQEKGHILTNSLTGK